MTRKERAREALDGALGAFPDIGQDEQESVITAMLAFADDELRRAHAAADKAGCRQIAMPVQQADGAYEYDDYSKGAFAATKAAIKAIRAMIQEE